jgi:hypothetical protein
VFVTNNLTGWPQWSPNGTMLALNTTNNRAGRGYPAHAPFLLVAHFPASKPTRPLRTVSSQPGSWAVAPTEYHPVFGYAGSRTFNGRGGGTVTVDYGLGSSVLSGAWSETYSNYSDNGKDFVNGTVTINETAPSAGTYTSNLTMTGAHTGSDHAAINTGTGIVHGQSTYDGHTVSGPSAEQAAKGACPSIQPKEPELHATATRARKWVYTIKVTSSIAGAGTNEAGVETSPVYHATVALGSVTTYTNRAGVATVKVRDSRRLTVTAGDTLKPTSLSLSLSNGRS